VFSHGKLFKVLQCISKVAECILKSCSVPCKETCFKVAEGMYHHVCIARKDVIKLRNVYIIKFV